MKNLKLTVTPESAGARLDSFAASDESGLSRSAAARLIEEGRVTVNGRTETKKYRVCEGDSVAIELPDPEPDEAVAQDIPLDIVYEDSDIIVVNKPSGMVVHPAAGNPDGTLVNALLHHYGDSLSGIGGVARPGIVHRIDKDTGGLLVVAKNDAAHAHLSEQLKTHDVSRIYHALVIGNLREDSGRVDAPIGRDMRDRKKMAVIRDPLRKSRDAVTHWSVLERFSGFCHVRCQLETGRTHQIRVHMSSIGHPLVGDSVYGGGRTKFEAHNASLISGQCLFAKELTLTHPTTGKLMHFEVDLPEEFTKLIEKMRAL